MPTIDDDAVHVIDTATVLTLQELLELKKLAQMSIIMRYVASFAFGLISIIGLPYLIDWFGRNFHT